MKMYSYINVSDWSALALAKSIEGRESDLLVSEEKESGRPVRRLHGKREDIAAWAISAGHWTAHDAQKWVHAEDD